MKTFYVTVAIFLSLVCIITFNYFFINRTAEKMSFLVDKIKESDNASSEVSILDKFWKDKQVGVSFSVNHLIVGRISDCIASMKSFAKDGDYVLLNREVALLEESIREMKRLERFSCENIL